MIKKYYRYGIPAEKKLFEKNKELYHGIILPAHLVADQTDSLKNFTKRVGKPYFIDPMTHVFGLWEANLLSPSTGEPRRSYQKLSKRLGNIFNINIRSERLSPGSFRENNYFDKLKISECVSGVLNFQRKAISDVDEDSVRYSELAKNIGESIPAQLIEINLPEFLVSPYFFSDNINDDFSLLNIELIRETVNQREHGEKILGVLTISKSMLSQINIDQVSKNYSECEGILLWIDDFNEYNSSIDELNLYKNLIMSLSNDTIVIMMYGGIFSGLLNNFGLYAYSSGICYGEKRPKIATIGGAIPPRLFIPDALFKLVEPEAVLFYRRARGYHCNCTTCDGIRKILKIEKNAKVDETKINEFFNEMFSKRVIGENVIGKLERSKEHYMRTLILELKKTEGKSANDIANYLREKAINIKQISQQYFNKIGIHLDKWAEAIEN